MSNAPDVTKSPYAIDVTAIMRKPGQMREISLDVNVPTRLGAGVACVESGSTLEIDGRLEVLHDGILASGRASGEMTAECVRCLDPISEPIQVDFAELFAYDLDEAYDYQIVDDTVDLEPAVRDAIVLALPFQPVCSPDCLGLDPATGNKLTEPLPEPEEQLDPRWAALAQFASDDTDSEKPEDRSGE